MTIKEIQAGYLNRLYFTDVYLYLAQNRLPNKKAAIKRVEILAEKYILLDSLLFKLTTIPGRETALLAIPEMCADKIITLYHSNLFAGHQGVIKTYLTINDRFFIPIQCIIWDHIYKGVIFVNWIEKTNYWEDNYKLEVIWIIDHYQDWVWI